MPWPKETQYSPELKLAVDELRRRAIRYDEAPLTLLEHLEEYPLLNRDPELNYLSGFICGSAHALGVTPGQLLESLNALEAKPNPILLPAALAAGHSS